MRFLVTGGAGFIGSAFIRSTMTAQGVSVVNVDKLTYAAVPGALDAVASLPGYAFERVDITDQAQLRRIFEQYRPDAVIHLAAETHVDRSIDSPAAFIRTNIVGAHTLLEEALAFWRKLPGTEQAAFRFLHVSTDEVFGSLGDEGRFSEETPYQPNSPYAASKAAADHLVRAWHRTYGFPAIISNCSNNYGPYQFPEKLIPLMIVNATAGKDLPIYGNGENVRDWLFVEDHVEALRTILGKGTVGQTYNIGGDSEQPNLRVAEAICDLLDDLVGPLPAGGPRRNLITFVQDRPGHDLRYAMDCSKVEGSLGWRPRHTFVAGLRRTVRWYLDHQGWWQPLLAKRYGGERLGLGSAQTPPR